MICPNCQAELPDGTKFCSSCGTPLLDLANKAEEVVSEVKEELPVESEVIPAVSDDRASDMPSASFDPGAPIAVPKQSEPVIDVSSDFPMDMPEVAPIENAVPEFQQPAPAPVLAPAPQLSPAPAAAPIPAPISLTPETVPAPVVTPNVSVPSETTDSASEQKILKTGTAVWLMLLFAIPVLGLIFAIIFAASGKKNKSRKNFAKAALIWQIILICIVLSLIIVCHFFAPDLFDAVINGTAYDVIDELGKIIPFL